MISEQELTLHAILGNCYEGFACRDGATDYERGIAAGLSIALSILDAYNTQPPKNEVDG